MFTDYQKTATGAHAITVVEDGIILLLYREEGLISGQIGTLWNLTVSEW